MQSSFSNPAQYQNIGTNSATVVELNAFKAKCQGIVDAFYKKLDQMIADNRTEVKRLEDENVQNY